MTINRCTDSSKLPDYTEDQIYRTRAFLARLWHQSISQITDYEAVSYLEEQRKQRVARRYIDNTDEGSTGDA